MEPALESVCKDVRIGKILIQTNENTDEPEVSELLYWSVHIVVYFAFFLLWMNVKGKEGWGEEIWR